MSRRLESLLFFVLENDAGGGTRPVMSGQDD